MKYLKEVRTMLLTAVLVVLLMNILTAIIQPWLPFLLIGLVVATVAWLFYSRATRL
ncbi:1,4-dihydroxy-2-naphthoate octaprenyltransferase [Pseudarthrobacter siccitolerans]|uniref:1,4-dihydroxy-2-naphthoate octaprenyltransferase n=1 Tax=Pseudarthrobacter siccitolerans TaxID=861266 RepID=A0ABU0PGA4_9MICC|nr:hypothetical protein [Pseudarthrobacter siccitolerans]MDQ0672983.1 1,4-dihydroxy-2-naphthoate octaprenyltransferase [Pseudarthrobacter siccitolerans]